jgi:hypothetical protein
MQQWRKELKVLVMTWLNQLRNKAKGIESFCLALNESNDISDTAQLLIIVRGVTESFEVVEELASPFAWHNRGGFVYECVCETRKEFKLTRTKLKEMRFDG